MSRFFRESVRYYSDSREIYDLLKLDLGTTETQQLDAQIDDAAQYFTTNFDAEILSQIVTRQRRFLRTLDQVVKARIGELRREQPPEVAEPVT